ncbi:MAG: toxin [Lentisphaerae bacterium GWF2_50_93]|nr:MAG: toxin [Lentisphaerae bacterium GWF2_50_93]
MYTMNFELDPKKSESNKSKHGIDFIDAQALWDDPDLIEIPAKTIDEPRYMVIGKIKDKHWSGIITLRDENIRIISIRRARTEEIEIYES